MSFSKLAKTLLKNLSGHSAVYQTKQMSSDPLFPTTTTTSYDITIYLKAPSIDDLKSGLASAEDVLILVSPLELGIEPKINDVIIASGKTYPVKKIITINEKNGVAALLKIFCEVR